MATYSYLDLSTGHLSREDLALAESGSEPSTPRVIPHKYGAWIAVPEDDQDDERRRSTTLSLQTCIDLARKTGSCWINFDSDGDREPQLPFYDW